MKQSKILRMLSLVIVLVLLIIVIPATSALARYLIDVDPSDGRIGDLITVTGEEFHSGVMIWVYFSSDDAPVGGYIDDEVTHYEKYFDDVGDRNEDNDGEFERRFNIPEELLDGDDEAVVDSGIYYIYVAYSNDVILYKTTFTVIGPKVDTKVPIISNVEHSGITKASVIIAWKTNERTTSQVVYRFDKYMYSPLDETLLVSHRVELTDLNPATTYHYQTVSRDFSGNRSRSEEMTFTTSGVPATFIISALTISPAEAEKGESITIRVLVTNTGDADGTYEATLKIDNIAVASQEVPLAGRTNQKVTFTTAETDTGTYSVGISGLSGKFVVRPVAVPVPAPAPALKLEPAPEPIPPAPAPAPTSTLKLEPAPEPTPTTEPVLVPSAPTAAINWWLIGGIITGAFISITVAVVLRIRRREW